MKNLIYVLVDALSYDNVGERSYRKSPTPFLDMLKEKSVFFEDMYTQAPYTEAAFVSSVCGENVLDHGGYLLGLDKCETCYASQLKEKGYHTMSTFSPYIMSKSYVKDTDQYYFSRAYSKEPLRLYRLEYYREKYLAEEINSQEYKICAILLEDSLKVWVEQIESLLHDRDSTVMIRDLIHENEELEDALAKVKTQYQLFMQDPKMYLESLFQYWYEHDYFKLPVINIKQKVKESTKAYLHDKYGDFLNNIQEKQNYLAKKNQKIDLAYLLDLAINDENTYHGAAQTYRRYKERYMADDILKVINESVEEKVTVSARTQLDVFAKQIAKYDALDENYFAFIHLEDFHLPSMFYTYDTNDRSIIDAEFEKLNHFVSTIPENYRGNLLADMSAFYVDMVLEEFFEKIARDSKNEFIFVVTADHGYPCNYNPPRPIIFNAFYQENYHIPCLVYDSETEKKVLKEGLYSSLDIMKILLNMVEENETEISSRDYVLIEYPGPGCPDISNKELYYAIFDGQYKLAFKVKLDETVTQDKVVLATNIKEDPDEKRNIKKSIKKNKRMRQLIELVDKRHREIREKFDGENFYIQMVGGN